MCFCRLKGVFLEEFCESFGVSNEFYKVSGQLQRLYNLDELSTSKHLVHNLYNIYGSCAEYTVTSFFASHTVYRINLSFVKAFISQNVSRLHSVDQKNTER